MHECMLNSLHALITILIYYLYDHVCVYLLIAYCYFMCDKEGEVRCLNL